MRVSIYPSVCMYMMSWLEGWPRRQSGLKILSWRLRCIRVNLENRAFFNLSLRPKMNDHMMSDTFLFLFFLRHIFHRLCIDPWLLEHRTCPMCKLDVIKALGYWVSQKRIRSVCLKMANPFFFFSLMPNVQACSIVHPTVNAECYCHVFSKVPQYCHDWISDWLYSRQSKIVSFENCAHVRGNVSANTCAHIATYNFLCNTLHCMCGCHNIRLYARPLRAHSHQNAVWNIRIMCVLPALHSKHTS